MAHGGDLLPVYSAVSPPAAVAALTAGIVDYAGLFPPATLTMAAAVSNYATYRHAAPHTSALLGRFVVPVDRLDEFSGTAAPFLSRAHDASLPWHLSALGGSDPVPDARVIAAFNVQSAGRAAIDTVDVRATTTDEITAAANAHRRCDCYIEVPSTTDLPPAIEAIARAGAKAKIRTGGTTPDAFPLAAAVVRFLISCRDASVAFKATAGLHHPFTADYRLTYEPASPTGRMHGFVNVFLAAAFIRDGMVLEDGVALLTDGHRDAFRFDDAGVTWRTHAILNGADSCSAHTLRDRIRVVLVP